MYHRLTTLGGSNMKNILALFSVTLFLASCTFPSMAVKAEKDEVTAQGLRPDSLCAADEGIIFTCPVAGQKLLSVCASQEYGPDLGFLQYRYGPDGEPEMILPAVKTAPAKAAQSGMLMFSGGGGAYLQFRDGVTIYTVYSAIGRWGDAGQTIEREGGTAHKGGRIIADIPCQAAAVSELGPAFFEKAGLPETEDDFDLP